MNICSIYTLVNYWYFVLTVHSLFAVAVNVEPRDEKQDWEYGLNMQKCFVLFLFFSFFVFVLMFVLSYWSLYHISFPLALMSFVMQNVFYEF